MWCSPDPRIQWPTAHRAECCIAEWSWASVPHHTFLLQGTWPSSAALLHRTALNTVENKRSRRRRPCPLFITDVKEHVHIWDLSTANPRQWRLRCCASFYKSLPGLDSSWLAQHESKTVFLLSAHFTGQSVHALAVLITNKYIQIISLLQHLFISLICFWHSWDKKLNKFYNACWVERKHWSKHKPQIDIALTHLFYYPFALAITNMLITILSQT